MAAFVYTSLQSLDKPFMYVYANTREYVCVCVYLCLCVCVFRCAYVCVRFSLCVGMAKDLYRV